MKMPASAPKVLICTAGLAIAFWCGRATSSAGDDGTGGKITARSQKPRPARLRRSSAKKLTPPAGIATSGAGNQAVKSIAQLQAIAESRGNMSVGAIQMALLKMNSRELGDLAENLVSEQAANPNSNYYVVNRQLFLRWAEVDPKAALQFASTAPKATQNIALPNVYLHLANLDPLYAWAETKTIKDPQLAHQIRSSVLRTMSSKNPDLWLDIILEDPKLNRTASMYSVAKKWAEDDPASAVARLDKLPPNLKQQAVPYIAAAWAEKDPAAALAWSQSLKNKSIAQQALSSIIGAVSNQDPAAAMDIINTLPAGSRANGLRQLYGSMATKDLQSALDQALALTNSSDKYAALNAVIGYSGNYSRSNWGSRRGLSIEQIKTLSEKLPTGELRDNALNQMANHLTDLPGGEIDSMIAGYSDHDRITILTNLLNSTSSTDPNRALEIYDKLPPGSLRNYQYSNILSHLSATEPTRALQLALGAKSDDHRSRNVSSVISAISQADPGAGAQLISTIEDEKIRIQAISTTASSWGRLDPDAALTWAERLPTEEKQKALSQIIPAMANIDPERASQMLDSYSRSGALPKNAVSSAVGSIANKWSTIDPQASAKWASQLPAGETQNYAVRGVVSQWATRDPDQAGQWIDSFPDGDTRDAGVRSFVSAIKRRDSAKAFDWANTISNNNQRLSELNNVIYQWKSSNPEKARAAVEAADLTDKEYDRLMQNFKP